MKRINPYTRLLNEIKEFCSKVKYPHKKLMWNYNIVSDTDLWSLYKLRERVSAADALGYDVKLEVDENKLYVFYVKKMPEIPYEWRF